MGYLEVSPYSLKELFIHAVKRRTVHCNQLLGSSLIHVLIHESIFD
jgi:hypothetical protein